jgi:uncharacterized membrane protein YcaP (DUF421 family)
VDRIFEVDWVELFRPTHSILEMIVRGALMYLGLFLILRFLMRRQTGSIGLADVLVIVIIADAAQNALSREYRSVTEGITLIITIVLLDYLIDWISYRFPSLKRILDHPPVTLVKDGRMFKRQMRRELITADELRAQLRKQGIEKLSDVKLAQVESDGEISVVRRTPGDHRQPQHHHRKPGA